MKEGGGDDNVLKFPGPGRENPDQRKMDAHPAIRDVELFDAYMRLYLFLEKLKKPKLALVGSTNHERMIKNSDDETLRRMVLNENEEEWKRFPELYREVIKEVEERKLFLK